MIKTVNELLMAIRAKGIKDRHWEPDQKDGMIGLLTKECKCVIDPEAGYVAGDDSDGRLTYWVMERMTKRRNGGRKI